MTARRAAALLVPLGLAGGEVWLTVASGGFFAGTTGIAVLATGLVLVAWLALAPRPLQGLTKPLAIALGALAAFALWTLLSQAWSDAAGRALVEFDRALLYVLALALFGLAAAVPAIRRAVPRAVALGFAAVSICGLATRLLPEVFPIAGNIEFERLSYPITYWNAQGAIGALAIVACVHLAASLDEPRAIRALAAGAVPLAATAVLFTFSRGPIAIAPVGVLLYLLLARPRGTASALLATLPTTAAALLVAYHADAVVQETGPSAAGISQGRTVAVVVAACAVAAIGAMAASRPLDRRAARWRAPSRTQVRWLAGGVVAAVVVVGAAVNAPRRVADQVDHLTSASFVHESGDSRQRLTQLADNGRIDTWRVSLDDFSAHPLLGTGAGTFALQWAQHRQSYRNVNDGHSLYLEVLGELGLVGALLVVTALGALLVGAALRIRGPDRAYGAAAVALLVPWALHAGVDWDWEMPALTLPVLAFAAAASGRPAPLREPVEQTARRPGSIPRLAAALALLAILLMPLALARSQHQLDRAYADLRANRCADAIAAARRSADVVSARPEPYEVTAICDARLGHPDVGLRAMQEAVRRDPGNWRLLYTLAVLHAAVGDDPRPTLRAAERANPRSPFVHSAVLRFRTANPADWRRRALTAPLPV